MCVSVRASVLHRSIWGPEKHGRSGVGGLVEAHLSLWSCRVFCLIHMYVGTIYAGVLPASM